LFSCLKEIKTHLKRALSSQFGFLFKDFKTALVTGGIIACLSIVAGWIPDGINEFASGNRIKGVCMFFTALGILLVLVICAYKLSGELEYDIDEEEPEKKKVLILFLSNVRADKDQIENTIKNVAETPDLEGKIEKIQNSKDMRNWRMPLEAIKLHLPKLKKVVVITSPASSKQFNQFKKLVETVFNKNFEIVEKKAKDFESVKHIFNIIREIFEELEREKYKAKDVIIDVTGGTKPVSIAGALTTPYYPDRKFQYISTTNYSVKSYDVRQISHD
jgi:hypothetical protein